jgi:TRAP-type C4-dicarboxylate transport system substrate-binding protein
MERENLHGDAKGKGTSGSNREAERTDAPARDGLLRSSDEAGVMPVERRERVIAIDQVNCGRVTGRRKSLMINGRRQSSCDGTSRMNREVHVRFCERLGVQFPGPTRQADVAWFLHGATPGRFPLTEIVQVPYLVGSAEIGTKVLNDPELRSKYIDAEHRGVKVLLLLTHQPGNVHTTKKPIRTIEDMKGLRLRFASPTIRNFIAALGGTPVGVVPTEQVEQLQKGTIDGVFIDYGGAGIAFKMGGILKYSTEMYSYVSSFGVAMNPDFWNTLPPDLQALVTKSMTGVEKEVGEAWDALDVPGKKALVDGGAEAIRLSAEENAKFRKIGAEVGEAKVNELESKGMPARAIYTMMKSLAEKHAKTSKNFWN